MCVWGQLQHKTQGKTGDTKDKVGKRKENGRKRVLEVEAEMEGVVIPFWDFQKRMDLPYPVAWLPRCPGRPCHNL